MTFELTIRYYEAGIGQPHMDKRVPIKGDSFREAMIEYYDQPNFDPHWRMIDAEVSREEFSVPSDKSV